MNDPAAEHYKRRMEISQEFWQTNQERAEAAEAALTAAVEQLREKDEELKRLKAENADIERVRHGLAKIYECNEKFHWKLADLIEPGIGGVSPLHFVEEGITKLRQQLAAANARLAAAESVFGKCEKAMQEAIIRVCFIGHPKEPIYMDGERRAPSWSKPLNLMQEARKEIKEGNWLPAEPQQQGGG